MNIIFFISALIFSMLYPYVGEYYKKSNTTLKFRLTYLLSFTFLILFFNVGTGRLAYFAKDWMNILFTFILPCLFGSLLGLFIPARWQKLVLFLWVLSVAVCLTLAILSIIGLI